MTMTLTQESTDISSIYPFPAIRVSRIIRDTGKVIGDFRLTGEIAEQLDQDQIGVLIANCGDSDRIYEQVMKLAETPYPACWVVVTSSLELARIWYAKQNGLRTLDIKGDSEAHQFWRRGNCWFTRLEQLEALSESPHFQGPVAGIILVDPTLRTQTARGIKGTSWKGHDRPELMNRFRQHLWSDGLRPPLIFMATPPAVSLNSLPAQRAYALDAFWYADGSRLRVGELPQCPAS
jgi:hypothetical protein